MARTKRFERRPSVTAFASCDAYEFKLFRFHVLKVAALGDKTIRDRASRDRRDFCNAFVFPAVYQILERAQCK